jgi:hypothetical protein
MYNACNRIHTGLLNHIHIESKGYNDISLLLLLCIARPFALIGQFTFTLPFSIPDVPTNDSSNVGSDLNDNKNIDNILANRSRGMCVHFIRWQFTRRRQWKQ